MLSERLHELEEIIDALKRDLSALETRCQESDRTASTQLEQLRQKDAEINRLVATLGQSTTLWNDHIDALRLEVTELHHTAAQQYGGSTTAVLFNDNYSMWNAIDTIYMVVTPIWCAT